MKGFKILAIRPLKGCNLDYLKKLEPETFYTFYNNYSFYFNEETDRFRIEYTPINEELYKIHGKKHDISVNVSAITIEIVTEQLCNWLGININT